MPADSDGTAITVHLEEILADRGMTMTELANRVGVTMANMSILKTGKAKAIRFTTLAAICEVLECQPGDVLHYNQAPENTSKPQRTRASDG